MNRHESCSFFPRKTGSQRKAKTVTVQRFFIQNHASSQNYLSRSSFWEFSKYEMLVKLKHIACWIEIPSFWLQALHSPQTFEMVWTKDEVDKYVVQVERNCKSAHEVSLVKHISFIAHRRNLFAFISILTITFPELQRNLKGFAFARLYREASDNETAKR